MKLDVCLTVLATILSSSLVSAESASSFMSKGDALLSAGEYQKAINAYDSAVQLDPQNYLYMIKRSAAYLSVGRNNKALEDLDRILKIKPGFESALTQRARINLKMAKFDQAMKDAKAAKGEAAETILAKITETKQLIKEAEKSRKKKEWENCIHHASEAIVNSPSSLDLRRTRVECRLANNDARESLEDLKAISALTPSDAEPYVKMAKIYFYAFNEYDNAMQQIQRCLRYDQDNKKCKDTHKQIRKLRKSLKDYDLVNRRKKASGHKLWGETEQKLIVEGQYGQIKDEANAALKEAGLMDAGSPAIVDSLVETLCDAYFNLKKYTDGEPYCDHVLQSNPTYTNALLLKAQKEIDAENYDAAVQILGDAIQEYQASDNKLHSKLKEAQTLAHRAKTKDYYKILDVSKTATEKEIKKAYRSKTKEYHPDKYRGDLTQDQVERKMSDINEAYEVLTDEEQRQRYDAGADINDQGPGGFGGGPGGPGGPGGGMHFNFQGFPGGGGQQFHFEQGGGFDFSKFADQFMRQQGGGGGGHQHHYFRQ